MLLAKAGVEREIWRPLLLWHMTRDEFLLRDFLINWLFGEYEGGVYRVRVDDVLAYLEDIERRGLTSGGSGWSDPTRKRVAAGLVGIAADFGLLRGSATKEFAGLHLRDESLLYLLHAVRDQEGSSAGMLAIPDWRMFLVTASDLERELLRLHQFKRLEFHRAGSLVDLALPFDSLLAYAESLAS